MYTTLATDIPGEVIPILAISGSFVVAVCWIAFSSVVEIAKSRSQERSRREIAAYIAEGSMTPEEGERLLKASPPAPQC